MSDLPQKFAGAVVGANLGESLGESLSSGDAGAVPRDEWLQVVGRPRLGPRTRSIAELVTSDERASASEQPFGGPGLRDGHGPWATPWLWLAETDGERLARELAGRARDESELAWGFVAGITAEAFAFSEPGPFLHYWLSESARAWMDRWSETDHDEAFGSKTRKLRRELQDMITLGINLRHRTPAEFVAAFAANAYEGRDWVVFRAVVATLSFAAGDLSRTLCVTAALPGPRSCYGSTLGLLAGAFYGIEGLAERLGEEGMDPWNKVLDSLAIPGTGKDGNRNEEG